MLLFMFLVMMAVAVAVAMLGLLFLWKNQLSCKRAKMYVGHRRIELHGCGKGMKKKKRKKCIIKCKFFSTQNIIISFLYPIQIHKNDELYAFVSIQWSIDLTGKVCFDFLSNKCCLSGRKFNYAKSYANISIWLLLLLL